MRALLFTLLLVAGTAFAATEFTYQGQLKQNGVAATGSFNMDFKLFDSSTLGVQQGSTVTKTGVAVSNGLFVVTLDFGQSVFDGTDRFLEVNVGGSALTRQKLTPTPYAIVANSLVAQPSVRVTSTVTQALPEAVVNTGVAPITFDTEPYDPRGMFDKNVSNSEINIPVSGLYAISAHFQVEPFAVPGSIFVGIRKNGTVFLYTKEIESKNGIRGHPELSIHVDLQAGDKIQLVSRVANSSGPRSTLVDAISITTLSVSKQP